MEQKKRWGKQKGRRSVVWERSNKSQAWDKEGCEKEGLGIEVISGHLSSGPTCVCVLGLNSCSVWGGTGVGGLDLETDWNLKFWSFRKSRGTAHCYPNTHLSTVFIASSPNPFLASVVSIPVFCTHLSEILDHYSTTFWNWRSILLLSALVTGRRLHGAASSEPCVPVLGCAILSKSLAFSETQFSHPQNERIGLDGSMGLPTSNIHSLYPRFSEYTPASGLSIPQRNTTRRVPVLLKKLTITEKSKWVLMWCLSQNLKAKL